MATCLLCKKDVTSGYVVCGDCAGKMKPGAMQPVLYGFAAWLGENMVQDHTLSPCSMCELAKLDACLDPDMCYKGVTDWFRAKVDKFLETSGYDGILGELKTVCPFPEMFEDLDDAEGPGCGDPRRKIGHIRADYDGYRWWNTVYASHWNLATAAVKAEMDCTYDALTASDALRDLNTLRRFCWSHPEAQAGSGLGDKFNFYLAGKTCDFWLRLITREKDYNLYLHAYARPAGSRERMEQNNGEGPKNEEIL